MHSVFCSKEPCSRCGRCCREFFTDVGLTEEEDRKIRQSIYSTTGIIYPHPVVMRLCVSPEEAEAMKAEAKNRGIALKIIPNKVVYDSENDKVVVIDFILDHDQCPFVSDENLCSIYGKRPRVCRQFPNIESNMPEIKEKVRALGINPNTLDYDSALKRVQELLGN